jgi:hypothetical protein
MFTPSPAASCGAINAAAFQVAGALCARQLRAGTGTHTRQPAAHP